MILPIFYMLDTYHSFIEKPTDNNFAKRNIMQGTFD